MQINEMKKQEVLVNEVCQSSHDYCTVFQLQIMDVSLIEQMSVHEDLEDSSETVAP